MPCKTSNLAHLFDLQTGRGAVPNALGAECAVCFPHLPLQLQLKGWAEEAAFGPPPKWEEHRSTACARAKVLLASSAHPSNCVIIMQL